MIHFKYIILCLVVSFACVGTCYMYIYQSNVEWRYQTKTCMQNRPSPVYNRVIGNHPCIDYAKRLPNCLIIGMMQCGTFALLTFLSAHPQVVRNESYAGLNFFGPNGCYWRGFSWYMDQMPSSCPGQIVIEGTPSNFNYELAPGRIVQTQTSIFCFW